MHLEDPMGAAAGHLVEVHVRELGSPGETARRLRSLLVRVAASE
jgi:hypothetical protein